MNPLLAAHLAELAKNMTAGQREQFMNQAQQRIEASGVPVSQETLNGAVSLLGMVGSGRLSVPGLSAQLIHTLKYGDPSKVTNAVARELSPQQRAKRAAQVQGAVEASAPIRDAGVTKLTSALNRAGEAMGGKSDLGDKTRERGALLAKAAANLGAKAKDSAGKTLEKTAEQRASAQKSARAAVQTASEAVGSANSASNSLRQQVNQVGVGAGPTGQITRMVGSAGRTVGSAGAVVDLAGVILDAMDDALRPRESSDTLGSDAGCSDAGCSDARQSVRTAPTPRPDRPEDI